MAMLSALSALLLTVVLSVSFFAIYIYSKLRKYLDTKYEVDKIPGPPAFPIVGNIPQVIGNRVQIFSNMRHIINMYGPDCFRCYIGPDPGVNVMSPEDVEMIISTVKNHAKSNIYKLFHNWLGTGLLTSEGEKWHVRRKILTPSFHFNILQQFVEVFNEHTGALVDDLRHHATGEGGVNVIPYITKFTLKSICQTAMGTSLDDDVTEQTAYRQNVHNFGEQTVNRLLNPLCYLNATYLFTKENKTLKEIVKFLHSFSAKVIKEKEKEFHSKGVEINADNGDCYSPKGKKLAMLDVLLSAKYKDSSIDDEGIREEVDTFIFEGHDTTAASICFSLMLLACNKNCQEKVYEEMVEVMDDLNRPPSYKDLMELKYMERCIKESLRLYPSVPHISRVSDGNITSEGYTIPKGCMINVLIYDMHRRPDLYPDPEVFDPDRFLPENIANRHPFAYIPFSAGPRNCIGQRFAILEIKAVLLSILKNFILEPVDTPKTVKLVPDLILRTSGGVKVRFVPRKQV